MKLKHDYFIIESLGDDDIKDGEIFSKGISSIYGYKPIYESVETPEEFEAALVKFSDSNYQYLFISAHGNEFELNLKNGDYDANNLADIPITLQNRRVFMSTCRGGTYLFARYFIAKGAYSVVGAPDDLAQIVATGLWVTMACIFERLNEEKINYAELNKTLDQLAKIYYIELAYYSFVRGKSEMKEYIYSPAAKKKRTDYPI